MTLKRFQGHSKVFSGLGRPVAYYADIARFLGNVKAALFLCQLIFWKDFGSSPDGWIYKTREEWTKETALSRSEQEYVRRLLRKKDYLKEERRGYKRQLFFLLNLSKIENDWLKWRINEIANNKEKGLQVAEYKPSWMAGNLPSTESTNKEDTRDIAALSKDLLTKMKI